MSLARRGAGGFKKKSKRRHKHSGWKNNAKKAAMGGAAGVAVSIPLTIAAKHYNQPILMEIGQRVGSIVSTIFGGTPGNAAYQTIDAVADRVVMYQGRGVTGTNQVYI